MRRWSNRSRLSVRTRLLVVLCALVSAVLVVGLTSWIALLRTTERTDRLHDGTLASVSVALELSQQASELATRAPYLLTLQSEFRLRLEAEAAQALVSDIARTLGDQADAMRQTLEGMTRSVRLLEQEALAASKLTDQHLRLNANTIALERVLIRRAAEQPDVQEWLALQRLTRALVGAGRADNLIGLGEFQRDYHHVSLQLLGAPSRDVQLMLDQLAAIALGPNGIFELRRLELDHRVAANAALSSIRLGAEAISHAAAEATARAQAEIDAERSRTRSAIGFAMGVVLVVALISVAVAVMTSFFVSGYVSANLGAIADAMMRLATGDRSSRLPRGEHGGDEIGTLFHAFRAFRANTLRLDRSNRQLAQRNQVFENLYEAMSDGLAILSETGRVLARNRKLAKVLRLHSDQLSGRPKLEGLLSAAGWQRRIGAEGLTELVHPEGATLELREGRLPAGGAVILFNDISERRFLEEQLRQAQRSEALGKIAGEVAHDFANILSTISTNLHLMETATPARAASLAQSLAAALELGTALTQRLLAFARRMHLEPEVMDLNTLVEGIEDLIALALDESIALEINVASRPLLVRIDPGQMESALLNLCLNSAQAIQGEGNISISLSVHGDNMVQLDVRDDGCGMTPEVLAHATEPFFTARADGTGTGLGLATVYGFMRQSGGDVVIESKEGEGTLVRLLLPLAEPAALPAQANLGPLRVLLVEDDPLDAARARNALGPEAVVTEARDAQQALRILAESKPFDLVLSDLHLQGEAAGWRIAETALMRDTRTKIVVVSGRLPAHDPLSATFPGRAFCLPKPINAAALADCLQERPSDDYSA